LSGKIIIDPTNPLKRTQTGLEHARWVEGMLILWINNRYGSTRDSFDFHLRKRK